MEGGRELLLGRQISSGDPDPTFRHETHQCQIEKVPKNIEIGTTITKTASRRPFRYKVSIDSRLLFEFCMGKEFLTWVLTESFFNAISSEPNEGHVS
jgi:hypothetical protein